MASDKIIMLALLAILVLAALPQALGHKCLRETFSDLACSECCKEAEYRFGLINHHATWCECFIEKSPNKND